MLLCWSTDQNPVFPDVKRYTTTFENSHGISVKLDGVIDSGNCSGKNSLPFFHFHVCRLKIAHEVSVFNIGWKKDIVVPKSIDVILSFKLKKIVVDIWICKHPPTLSSSSSKFWIVWSANNPQCFIDLQCCSRISGVRAWWKTLRCWVSRFSNVPCAGLTSIGCSARICSSSTEKGIFDWTLRICSGLNCSILCIVARFISLSYIKLYHRESTSLNVNGLENLVEEWTAFKSQT